MQTGGMWATLALGAGLILLGTFFLGFAPLSFVIFLASALPVLGALDAALQPESAWVAADQNKVVWVALQLGGLLVFYLPGILAAVAYLAFVRPRLRSRSPIA